MFFGVGERKWTNMFKVGDIVTRDGTDRHEVIIGQDEWPTIRVRCIKAPVLPWTSIGTEEDNLARRYQLIKRTDMEKKDRKKNLKHDYSGDCVPGGKYSGGYLKFSVGIFQWLPKAGGKGLKKSKVIYRISGFCANPDAVYRRAEFICERLDSGDMLPKRKSETV